MAVFDVNFNPSDRQLRQFGAVCLVALPLLAWSFYRNLEVSGWAAVSGLALFVSGCIAPKLLRPAFLGLTIITLPIGLIVGEAVMLLIFFGLFLPMSVLFRIAGHDFRGCSNLRSTETCWRERKQPRSAGSYFHQF